MEGLKSLTQLLVRHASYVVQSDRLVILFDGILSRLSDANTKVRVLLYTLLPVFSSLQDCSLLDEGQEVKLQSFSTSLSLLLLMLSFLLAFHVPDFHCCDSW